MNEFGRTNQFSPIQQTQWVSGTTANLNLMFSSSDTTWPEPTLTNVEWLRERIGEIRDLAH